MHQLSGPCTFDEVLHTLSVARAFELAGFEQGPKRKLCDGHFNSE